MAFVSLLSSKESKESSGSKSADPPVTAGTPAPAEVAAPAEPPGTAHAPKATESVAADTDPRAWVIAELPPAYQEIAGKIAALREEAKKYEGIAGVLWQVGRPLADGVREIFTALKFDTTLTERESGSNVIVQLAPDRRLVVEVSGSTEAIDRKSPVMTELLRILQNDVSDQDRLVLALNSWCELPLEARKKEIISADALKLAQRVGANIVATSTLFGLWRYSLTNLDAARQSVMKLHSHDGGIFK